MKTQEGLLVIPEVSPPSVGRQTDISSDDDCTGCKDSSSFRGDGSADGGADGCAVDDKSASTGSVSAISAESVITNHSNITEHKLRPRSVCSSSCSSLLTPRRNGYLSSNNFRNGESPLGRRSHSETLRPSPTYPTDSVRSKE